MNKAILMHFSLGPIVGALVGAVYVPLLAWVAAPEDIGRNNIFQIALSFSTLFFVLGLDQAYMREYRVVSNKESLFKTCVLPGIVLYLLCWFLGTWIASDIAFELYETNSQKAYHLTMGGLLLALIVRYLSILARLREDGWIYSLLLASPRLFCVLFICSYVGLGSNIDFSDLLLFSLLGTLFPAVAAVFYYRKFICESLKAKFEWGFSAQLLSFGLPLLFSGVIYWILLASSTVLIKEYSGLESLAIYSLAVSLAGPAALLRNIFASVWMPQVYKWIEGKVDLEKIWRISDDVLAVSIFLVIVMGFGASFVGKLLPPEYHLVGYILPLAVLVPIFYTLSEVTVIGINISRKTSATIYIVFVSAAVNIGCGVYLISGYGAVGAVIANAIAYLLFLILRTEVSCRVWRSFPRMKLYFWVVICMCAGVVHVCGLYVDSINVFALWALLSLVYLFSFRKNMVRMLWFLKVPN
ncbi:hypothetical protein EHF36_09435 [Kerstersia gyiorum]|uniref:lipopolysaccharide biosynthesis protein n=1 Tax=Kerstersia gyiorum TaxID=206506 RepID=UPI001070C060|nr:oligosaccharide flippase family protein [Kerstersia gyiorum]QBR40823.1 hypothetical protein EHF36_09435 [Kerstersia gyiorum]